jgi:two-component system sensor histidine kinase BaeS
VKEFFGSSGFIEFGKIDELDVAEELEKGEDVLNGVFFEPSEFAEPALLYIESPEGSGVSAVFSGRLLLGVLIVAGAATLITILLARRLMRPITELTSAAEGLQTGDLSYRVEVDEDGEIGGLAEAFNSMAESLEESDGLRRTMTADIAHELRTPLANIRGYLEAAQEGVVAPDEGLLATVHEETMMLQHLVEDLETLTQADAGRLQLDKAQVSLPEVVAHVADAHRARAEATSVALAVEGPEFGLDVSADGVRLRQAIGNMVDNAIRHTKSGGTVTIAAERIGADAVVMVSDTGDGIPPEHLPHVFDRFYRADPSRNRATGGSGLGLAIARQIAEAHGGSVDASSMVGEGTTVTFRLPLPSVEGGV